MGKVEQRPKFKRFLIAGIVLLMIVIAGLSGYLWQESDKQVKNNYLIAEINGLHGELIELKLNGGKEVRGEQVAQLKGAAEAKKIESGQFKDIKFECQHPTQFWRQAWYSNFKNTVAEKGIDLSQSTSACLSGKTNLLIFMIPGKGLCEMAQVYRYDTGIQVLERAILESGKEKCLSSPDYFGARVGNVIKMKGIEEDGNCKREYYYEYDFLNNRVEFKEKKSICNQ